MGNILSLILSFVLSLLFTPIMKKIAIKYKIVDIPNQRKSHKKEIPYLGGVSIFIGSIISILFFAKPVRIFILYFMILALFAIMLMGLIDDIKDLPAKFRLGFIFITSLSIVLIFQSYNFGIKLSNNLFFNILIIAFFVIWLVAITNAINWSDGLDGLASSQVLISVIGFSILFWIQGRDQFILPISLALVGSLVGFLPYNISPAKIFMGDAGSMYIGFLVGILSIASITQEESYLVLIVPIYLVMMPVLDMGIVMFRRKINNKSMMAADKTHLHHILNKKYNNQKKVVLIISLFQSIFVTFAIIIYLLKIYLFGIIILFLGLFCLLTFIVVNKYKNK